MRQSLYNIALVISSLYITSIILNVLDERRIDVMDICKLVLIGILGTVIHDKKMLCISGALLAVGLKGYFKYKYN